MPTPQIIWCAQSSMHYIIEGPIRYAMPLFLAIQIKEYLKNCHQKNSDCVAKWVSCLGPADRMLVKVVDQRDQADKTHFAPVRFCPEASGDQTPRRA